MTTLPAKPHNAVKREKVLSALETRMRRLWQDRGQGSDALKHAGMDGTVAAVAEIEFQLHQSGRVRLDDVLQIANESLAKLHKLSRPNDMLACTASAERALTRLARESFIRKAALAYLPTVLADAGFDQVRDKAPTADNLGRQSRPAHILSRLNDSFFEYTAWDKAIAIANGISPKALQDRRDGEMWDALLTAYKNHETAREYQVAQSLMPVLVPLEIKRQTELKQNLERLRAAGVTALVVPSAPRETILWRNRGLEKAVAEAIQTLDQSGAQVRPRPRPARRHAMSM